MTEPVHLLPLVWCHLTIKKGKKVTARTITVTARTITVGVYLALAAASTLLTAGCTTQGSEPHVYDSETRVIPFETHQWWGECSNMFFELGEDVDDGGWNENNNWDEVYQHEDESESHVYNSDTIVIPFEDGSGQDVDGLDTRVVPIDECLSNAVDAPD